MVSDFPLTSGTGQDHRPELSLLLDLSQDLVMEGLLLHGRRREAALRNLSRRNHQNSFIHLKK